MSGYQTKNFMNLFFGAEEDFSFEAQARQFTQLGVFESAIGDAMLLGISNVLQLEIIVFTSIESWPHITIQPRLPPLHPNPILLAFLHAGPGHYSLALSRQKPASQPSRNDSSQKEHQTSKKFCRCGCGRNVDKQEWLSCSKKMAYHSRCPCLKADMSCTQDCKCRNCDNPYGTSDLELEVSYSSDIKYKRKRARHSEQDLLQESSMKYMEQMDEQPLCGMWTAEEH